MPVSARIPSQSLPTVVAAALLTMSGVAVAQQPDAAARNAARVSVLEARMPLGPKSAKGVGLQAMWRYSVNPASTRALFMSEGAAFLINSNNEVIMLDLETGRRKWTAFGGGGSDLIVDVVHVKEDNKVLVVRSNSILTLSSTTGLPIPLSTTRSSVQPLEWLSDTRGAISGTYYIYGGLAGEVVWQDWRLGFPTNAHRIGRKVQAAPALFEGKTIASSRTGELAAMAADDGLLLWQKMLLGPMAGNPVSADMSDTDTESGLAIVTSILFVASEDQYLRAYNLANGKLRWARLFDQPLKNGPVLAGQRILQQVPGTGLVCMEGLPADSPEGKVVWKAPTVLGQVIGSTDDLLLVWDEGNSTLQTVSEATGSIDATSTASNVSRMAIQDNTLLLLGGQNELVCYRPTLGH
jgi:outer membrane protein assembly factor BamB